MARATAGPYDGAWYFEIKIVHLGETGHTRLGWSTSGGDLQAPVGYDTHSYGYRDVDGSKVHNTWREEYGAGYGEGDVVGCYINLPKGVRPEKPELVDYRGKPHHTETVEVPQQPLKGEGRMRRLSFRRTSRGRVAVDCLRSMPCLSFHRKEPGCRFWRTYRSGVTKVVERSRKQRLASQTFQSVCPKRQVLSSGAFKAFRHQSEGGSTELRKQAVGMNGLPFQGSLLDLALSPLVQSLFTVRASSLRITVGRNFVAKLPA